MKRLLVILLVVIALVLMALLTSWWLVPFLTFMVGDGFLLGLFNRLAQFFLLSAAAFLLASWWDQLREELRFLQKKDFLSRSEEDKSDEAVKPFRQLEEQQKMNLFGEEIEGSDAQSETALHDKLQFSQQLTNKSQISQQAEEFTGRQMELQELVQRVTEEGVRVVALQAEEAAVGKTALALKLAERLRVHYDEQIVVDMRGSSEKPLTSLEAMRKVIYTYQPNSQLPQEEEQLKKWYIAMLANQPLILLLDDVANQPQIESLLPPSPSAQGAVLLITSRQYFVLPGMTVKRLGRLFADDARTLLLRLTPRIGEEASELATLCSLHPLALRLAASMLATRRELIPAQYIWQLRDPQRPFSKLTGLEKLFNLNYELMEEKEQILWRMLAIFSGSFDQAAAAALWELEPDPTLEMLNRLLAFSFIDPVPEPKGGVTHSTRLQLQKVMRHFALDKLLVHERVAGRRRLAIHFETILRQANSLYQQEETKKEGFNLFKQEWAHIQAGQAWAAELVGQDKVATTLAIAYPEVGLSLLMEQKAPKQIDWLKTALVATRHLKHRDTECKYLGYLGQAYAHLGEVRRAITNYEQQLTISRELGIRLLESNALGNLGSAYMQLNNLRQAISYYEQQLMVTRHIIDSPEVRQGEAKTLEPLGKAYQEIGQWDHAKSCYEQQLNIAHEFEDSATESRALALLGDLYTEGGDFSNALVCYGQHLTLERELGHQAEESIALGKLGHTYADIGDNKRALKYYKQQLLISRKIGNQELEGQALGNLGIVYAELGQIRHAIDYSTQALEIDRTLGNREGEAIGAWNLALIYYQLDQFNLAAELMQITVDYERSIAHPDAETHAHYLEIVQEQAKS